MAISSVQDGQQLAVIGTLHALGGSVSTNGSYVLKVSLLEMVEGDRVELRIDTKTRSGGAWEVAYNKPYIGPQEETIIFSTPVPNDTDILAYIKQTDGTGRSYNWNLLNL